MSESNLPLSRRVDFVDGNTYRESESPEYAPRTALGTGLRGSEREIAMGTRLYVGNLPYDTDEDTIKQFFETGGARQVRQVKIVTDRDTGRPRGFAFVEVADDGQARSAIDELNGRELGGRTIVVNEAREPQRGGRGGGGGGGGYGGGGGGRGGYGGGGGGGGYGGRGGGGGGGYGGRGGGGGGRGGGGGYEDD
jgi:hypothetical protein